MVKDKSFGLINCVEVCCFGVKYEKNDCADFHLVSVNSRYSVSSVNIVSLPADNAVSCYGFRIDVVLC